MDGQNKDPPPDFDEFSGYPPQQNVDHLHQGKYPPQGTTIPLQHAYPPQGTTVPVQYAYPPQGTTLPVQYAYPPQGTTLPVQYAYPPQGTTLPVQYAYPPQGTTIPVQYAYPTEGINPFAQDDIFDNIVGVGNCTIDTENLIPMETGGLSDTKIRHGFIRKVYVILCVQFGIAVASIFLMRHFFGNLAYDGYYYNDYGSYLSSKGDLSKKVQIAMWSCFAIAFVLGIALLIHEVRRKHPTNIILLILFTLAMSGFLGCVTVSFEAQFITITVVCTCIITLSLTLFACQTKIDVEVLELFVRFS